jgi:alkanesulfonate monooxygenase SsuD/methylene tetrahydromethanopterin reductase-like flavin-dependent oxidoreductase (luciferase family)
VDIGVGLPTTVPGISGPVLIDWARRAEQHGFSSLGVLDRLVYDNYEPLVSLAAAAAVTQRIQLATTILIAPYRDSAAVLAKQVATLDHLSGGRVVFGVAAGGREDDFAASGACYTDRGRRMDAMVGQMRKVWDGGGPVPGIGPRPPRGGPTLLVGGHSPAAMRRAATYGDGWIAGGSSVTRYAEQARKVRVAWAKQGRTDRPRMVSLAYVALGPAGRERAERYLGAYYAFTEAEAYQKAKQAAVGVITDAGQLRATCDEYAAAGCDELLFFPCVSNPGQVDLIAKAMAP